LIELSALEIGLVLTQADGLGWDVSRRRRLQGAMFEHGDDLD
jgi:hypothetical protein